MDKQRYTLPEDKDGKVAEPAVASGTAAHDLQTLRHRIVDAVYQSNDAEKLQSCYIMLTLNDKMEKAQTEDFLQFLPKEQIVSAMEFAWKEHQAGRTQPLSSVLDEIKEARAWK